VPEGTEGIVLTWRIMGSNGMVDWNPGLAIESYTRGAPDDFRKGWGVKTLFRPFPDFRFGIHRPTVKGAGRDPERRAQLSFLRWVNGSGLPMTRQFLEGMWRSSAATLGYDLAEMAHFAVKSREAYLLRQIRGNVNSKPDKYDATYFGIFDRNETEQTGLCGTCPPSGPCRGLPARSDPAGLHQDGLAWHARQIERLRAEETHPRRMARLEHLAGVAYEGLDALLFTQPLGPKGKSIVDKLRRDGMTPDAIARHVAASVAKLEAERDARDFEELAALGDRAALGRVSCACPGPGSAPAGSARRPRPARAPPPAWPAVDGASSLSPTCIARASAGEAVADIGRFFSICSRSLRSICSAGCAGPLSGRFGRSPRRRGSGAPFSAVATRGAMIAFSTSVPPQTGQATWPPRRACRRRRPTGTSFRSGGPRRISGRIGSCAFRSFRMKICDVPP
jgi:hypothetical protein